jgi:hypothetical protein
VLSGGILFWYDLFCFVRCGSVTTWARDADPRIFFNLPTKQAEERLLAEAGPTTLGAFLMRQRTGDLENVHFAVVESKGKVRHHVVTRHDGEYLRSDLVPFPSLEAFIRHHQNHVQVFPVKLTVCVAAAEA